jgi:hypothetical protein
MRTARLSLFAAAAALCGCAATTNPPLLFGDVTTFGLRLGNDNASAGGSATLGYKNYSVALVPVSILDENGDAKLIKGRYAVKNGSQKSDAMSVFASFSDETVFTAAPQKGEVRLGQVFSTGLAAQTITLGVCKASLENGCSDEDASSEQDRPGKDRSEPSLKVAATSAPDRPYQSPLLFMRTDVTGIDIGGSLAQDGMQFVLGYGSRDLALIPVAARQSGGRPLQITSSDDRANGSQLDTLSVMGQFRATTETSKLNAGLTRYFATGVAARNLSVALNGHVLSAALASHPASAAQPAASAAQQAARVTTLGVQAPGPREMADSR